MMINKKSKVIEAPMEMDQVMDSLKRLDARNKRLMRSMYILYIVFAVIYTGLLILNPDPELDLNNRIQGILYVLIFSMSALYFRYNFKKNKAVDYSAPILEMLTAARKRHQLWTRGTILFIITLVSVTDIVVTWAILDDDFLKDHSLICRILWIQAGYFLVMGISFVIGYLSWRKKSMPLVRNLTRIIEEMEEE